MEERKEGGKWNSSHGAKGDWWERKFFAILPSFVCPSNELRVARIGGRGHNLSCKKIISFSTQRDVSARLKERAARLERGKGEKRLSADGNEQNRGTDTTQMTF